MRLHFSFCVFFFALQSQARGIESFAGNYDPIGDSTKCGIHLEVSGNMIVATNIAPPSKKADYFCSQLSSGCGGESFSIDCHNKQCFGPGGDLVLSLLNDGNIFFNNSGTKFYRSSQTTYYWCVYQ